MNATKEALTFSDSVSAFFTKNKRYVQVHLGPFCAAHAVSATHARGGLTEPRWSLGWHRGVGAREHHGRDPDDDGGAGDQCRHRHLSVVPHLHIDRSLQPGARHAIPSIALCGTSRSCDCCAVVLLGPLVVLPVAGHYRLRYFGGRACTQFVSLNYSAVRVRSLLPPCSFVKARPLTARCVCACAVPQQRGLDDG